MFTTKTERSNAWPTSAVSPRATTIATSATSTGTSPATTAPNTRSSTTSAAGSPNCSSPFRRSSCESVEKSRSAVNSPVIAVSNPSPAAASTTSITCPMPASPSPVRPTGITVARRLGDTRVASCVE